MQFYLNYFNLIKKKVEISYTVLFMTEDNPPIAKPKRREMS